MKLRKERREAKEFSKYQGVKNQLHKIKVGYIPKEHYLYVYYL